jgi:hypothetical protein
MAAVSAGCGGGGAKESGEPARAQGAAQTDASRGEDHMAGIVPGSYEDWCAEHGVRETLCTRCNPKLIAAFQATGDWCAEHGLPESQCLICNPDLVIVRPPKPEGS